MNYKLGTGAGDSFDRVSKKAKDIAVEKDFIVEFDFNDIICLVSKDTNLDWLYRDYANSLTMGWKQVGPECLAEYEPEVAAELKDKKEISEKKAEAQRKEWEAKEEKERQEFNKTVEGVDVNFSDKKSWEEGWAKNKDGYGNAVYEYAEGWAKLMQVEIDKGNPLPKIADVTSHKLGFLGITGFQYGAAVSILAHCWVHGEQLRKWHNKEYNHEGDGVVNPAILTLQTADQ